MKKGARLLTRASHAEGEPATDRRTRGDESALLAVRAEDSEREVNRAAGAVE